MTDENLSIIDIANLCEDIYYGLIDDGFILSINYNHTDNNIKICIDKGEHIFRYDTISGYIKEMESQLEGIMQDMQFGIRDSSFRNSVQRPVSS